MSDTIKEVTGVPVITLTYDGTSKPVNESIIPYITYLRKDLEDLKEKEASQ